MSGKNSISSDKSGSDDDSSCQSFVRAELLQADPNISKSDIQPRSGVENSLGHDMATLKEPTLEIQSSNSEASEPPNETTAICNIISPRSVMSQYSIEILSYVRTEERVLGEEAILDVLDRCMSPLDKSTRLSCVGSVFYKVISQKSDLNILVTTGE